MARIPAAEVDRLKAEVSLAVLVEARGIALARHGAGLIGLCPFHEDHEPSLVISPAKNLWHCLGACQAGGSVIVGGYPEMSRAVQRRARSRLGRSPVEVGSPREDKSPGQCGSDQGFGSCEERI